MRRPQKAKQQAKKKGSTSSPKDACVGCGPEGCFKKPKNATDSEFDKQLKEQEDAINNTKADDLVERRDAIKKGGGTDAVRDHAAQRKARDNYENDRRQELLEEGVMGAEADKKIGGELDNLAATHRLDIIAGGDPSDISGMGDRRVNSSLGPQWRGKRAQTLENHARQMQAEGRGQEKMKVKLKKC